MAATRLIAMHVQKNRSVQQCLKDRTDYAENGEKTENGEYISSYECDPETVDQEFAFSKSRYGQLTGRSRDDDIIAYQIRQSFKPGEVTPEEANRIGYETAMRWTKGNHAFIVATHVDKAHIHNHVIYNSTTLDCFHKFRNFLFCGIALQRVSDLVCLEHGCSVIKPRKPGEREKRTVYPNRKSIRDKIREDIDLAMSRNPKNMEELLKYLEEMGYEIKRAKHIGIKGEVQKTFLRFDSLGAGYREEDFEKVFKGEESFNPPPREKQSHRYEKPEKKFDMLLDIQDIIARGKGPGYERWAKVHNIKQISQTLIYLRDHDIRDMDELTKRASDSAIRFAELSQTIKDAEKRMAEIAVLITHIINYSKTKDVYVAYRKTGYSKQFFEAHREEILLHKAAKEAFGQLEAGVPKIKDLNQEYSELLKKKKTAYAEYRKIKEENKELQMAKHNLERFLNQQEEERKQKEKQQSKSGQSL
ncbi:MAG: relaxase/mobilization nuclease domain-containing protein [Lachnospiraceae bacterium]